MTDPDPTQNDYAHTEALYLASTLLDANGSVESFNAAVDELSRRVPNELLRTKVFTAAATMIILRAVPHLAEGRQGRDRLSNLAADMHSEALSRMVGIS